MSKDGVNTTARSNGLIEHIKKRRTLIVALSAVIVFATVYALILPAITLDKETAGKQGGIDVVTEQSADTDAQAQEADQNKAKKEDQKDAAARGQLLHEGKDYSVKAAYDEKAGLPENTELEVKEVTDKDKEYQAWYDETLKALQESKGGSDIAELTIAKFYDISLTANGDTLAPEAPVDVTITYDKSLKAKDADQLRIVHFIANKDGSHKAEILDSDKVEPTIKEGELTKVSFEAEAFSMYAVAYAEAEEDADAEADVEADEETGDKNEEKADEVEGTEDEESEETEGVDEEEKDTVETEAIVEDNAEETEEADEYEYTLRDDEEVRLSQVLTAAGTDLQVKDVNNVLFSDKSRVKVKKNLFGYDWTLQALKGFDSEETLTVIQKGGERIEITVTYVSIPDQKLSASGKDYSIWLSYSKDADIPAGSKLNVTEIKSGTDGYGRYLDESAEKLGVEGESVSFARFFDVEIIKNGKKIEPKEPVQVQIIYKDGLGIGKNEELNVVHFAGEGTEVIEDVAVSTDAKEIYYEQGSFSVTGTIVSAPANGSEYALVVKYDGNYYAVQNDGSLAPVESYSPETGTIETTDLNETTIMWSYGSVASINPAWGGNNSYTLRYRSDSYHYTEVGLPIGFTYRYINPDQEAGFLDVDDGVYDDSRNTAAKYRDWTWYSTINYDSRNHRISGYGDQFIGVTEKNGALQIVGKVISADEAAEIYLAQARQIASVNVRNHTVNHIDISVDGSSSVKVPLAYGKYKLAEVDDDGNIIGYRSEDLTVSKTNKVTAEGESVVSIEPDDLKQADFEAFTTYKGHKEVLSDVFYVTGYTGNEKGSNDTPQVRLEGSFKVSDVDPVPRYENENSERIRNLRIERPIYYKLTMEKEVSFTLKYVDPADGKEYVVIREGEPFVVTLPETLSNTFSYWDPDNECPGIGLYGRDKWEVGYLQSNSWWTEGDGGPGMDFRMYAKDEADHDIVAIEVVKSVQDMDGNMLHPADEIDCSFNVYQSDSKDGDATLLHDKTMTIGEDGYGLMFDYDVEGGTYAAPKYAQIAEKADSVNGVIVDTNGDTWVYDHSSIDTEYVWRDFGNPELHIGEEVSKEDGDMYSDREILGEYHWDHYPEHYEYEGQDHDGNEYNRFLEFFVYNVYKKVPPVDVPIEKTWDDFDGEGADWSATMRLQWAPIYEGQTEVGADFQDVEPIQEITITKDMMAQGDASLASRTFENLPKYGYDPETGRSYRIQYSVEEMAYTATKDGVTYTYRRSTQPGVPDTYTPAGEDNRFTAFFPHDAGELSEDDTDYYVAVANHPRDSKNKKYIDFDVTKTWDEEILEDDSAYATFKVLYNKRVDYRDVSHMTDADRNADPITVTLKDSNGKVYDTVTVQPHTGLRISVTRNGKAGESTYTISGGDYTPSQSWMSPEIKIYYNLDKVTKFFDGKAYPASSCDITISGDLDYLDSAKLLDTTPGNTVATAQEAMTFTLNKEHHWTKNLELLHEETVAGGDANNENVEVYEYYLEEVESNPEGFYAKFFEQGTEIEEGGKYHPIVSGDQDIEARNEPAPELTVQKKWRGVSDTDGYPAVTFTLYQCRAGAGMEAYKRDVVSVDGQRFEGIELNSENNYTWTCPVVLPTRDTQGNRLAYYVVEDDDSGSYGGVSWQCYGYSQEWDPTTKQYTHQADRGQAITAQLAGNDGTLLIHNKVGDYLSLDIKKQYFDIGADGSWGNVTAQIRGDTILGFKVIRRILDYHTKEVLVEWRDYGDEILAGYINGEGVSDAGTNDFYVVTRSDWYVQILDNNAQQLSGTIGLPKTGYYRDGNGDVIPVMYQYSFRETGVYRDLNKNPYPDWEWYSNITPDNYYDKDGTYVFDRQERSDDPERIENYHATDLLVKKHWLGKANAKKVYVKIWRKAGEGETEDFTRIIAEDVTGASHPAEGSSNWQGYLDDPERIDTEKNALILEAGTGNEWELTVHHLLLYELAGLDAAPQRYSYYIQEVGYQDKDGNDHWSIPADAPEAEDLAELETHYTRWIDDHWEPSPSTDGKEKMILLGDVGENKLMVMNAPEMDLNVEKKWLDEDGNPRDAWRDSISFQIEQVSTKYDLNGDSTGETKKALVKIGGQSTFTISKNSTNPHWIIKANHAQHDQYTIDREDARTNDAGDPWTFYVDGLQEGYFDADNNEWHCTYNIKEVVVPKSEVEITGNGVSENGKTVEIKNTHSDTSSVQVTKIFSGVNALPDEFRITAEWTDKNGDHTINLTPSGTQPENVTLSGNGSASDPYVWTISKIPVQTEPIQVTFTESGFEDDNQLVVVSSTTDDNVDNENPQTAVMVSEDTINSGNFTNTYGTNNVDITLLKIDGTTEAALGGAKFSLSRSDTEAGSYTIVTEIEDVDLDEQNRFTVPEAGLTLKGLSPGFYKIREEVAPAGYLITDTTPVWFEVKSDGTVENKSIEAVTYDSENLSFTVPDPPGTELPNSGGPGTTWIYLIGAILLLGCGISLIARRRVRRGI